MEQSPWNATTFIASTEINCIHYIVHKSPLFVLSQINQVFLNDNFFVIPENLFSWKLVKSVLYNM